MNGELNILATVTMLLTILLDNLLYIVAVINRCLVDFLQACIIQQRCYRIVEVVNAPNDLSYQFALGIVLGHFLLQKRGKSGDPGEWIPDLVGDSGRHFSQRRESVQPYDLLLHLFELGQVLKYLDRPACPALFIFENSG